MKRPLRSRIWFYKPWWGYYWPSKDRLYPRDWWKLWWFGGDEFDWHTLVIGHNLIGSVVIATHKCPGTGRCAGDYEELHLDNQWPIDQYGHDHSDAGNCQDNCYCKDEQ